MHAVENKNPFFFCSYPTGHHSEPRTRDGNAPADAPLLAGRSLLGVIECCISP